MKLERDAPCEPFKQRELEILSLIANGLTNEEIAAKLFIGVTTVRWYNRQIYRNLGVHHRTLAVARARKLGLLDPEVPPTGFKKDGHAPPRDNLPAPATSFIGREREVAKVRELLHVRRLLTLTGSGGIGKTRLALQVAELVRHDYPDGVWFIALAQIQAAEAVPTGIAEALQIEQKPVESLETRLIQHLRSRKALLILDNFEHLMPAATFVSTLLAAAPQIRILVTSREILRLSGEQQFVIPPLKLGAENIQTLMNCEAVRLFIERAREHHPDFRLKGDDAAVIAQICARLDGLPLAIELAAARIKLLTPQQMLARLEKGFGFLGQGPRDAPLRHQTLQAAIDWSYHLLNADERKLFLRLSIFRAGWTLAEVEAMRGQAWDFDVFDGLHSLLDKSLVQVSANDAGELRFEMLAVVRAYALAQSI